VDEESYLATGSNDRERRRVPVLHVLTSDETVARTDFLATATDLIRTVGSRGAFHLRTRTLTGRAYTALAVQLAAVCRTHDSTLVINGRVDVALAANAHGVQLGRGALAPQDVRGIAPHLAVGVSIHSVTVQIPPTPSELIDWIIFGQLFESQSHPGGTGQGLMELRHMTAMTNIPIVAVGGITPERIAKVRDAGAAGIAVISGIWDAREPSAAATHYLSLYGDDIVRGSDPSHS
jgi:thiazole tautomerase (transcriptional regulator TenI)